MYRIRRLLTAAHERISDRGQIRLRGLLDAGDPYGEVRTAWHAKETVRGIYGIDTPVLALRYTLQLADDLQHESCPPEINKLGRTIARWTPQITNWHITRGNQQTPPKPSTTSSNGSNEQRSGYPTSRTTESGPFSTRGNPTGTSSHRSLPTEIHSYLEGSWAGTGLTQLKSGFVPFHRSVGLFPAWGCNPLGRGGCDLIGAFEFSTVSGLSTACRVRGSEMILSRRGGRCHGRRWSGCVRWG